MSNVARSKCSGGCHEMRSSGAVPKYARAQRTKWSTFPWVMTTPVGRPVGPDVKSRCAGSPTAFSYVSGDGDWDATSAVVNVGWKCWARGARVDSQPTACVAANAGSANSSSSCGAAGSAARIQRQSHDTITYHNRPDELETWNGTHSATGLGPPRIANTTD